MPSGLVLPQVAHVVERHGGPVTVRYHVGEPCLVRHERGNSETVSRDVTMGPVGQRVCGSLQDLAHGGGRLSLSQDHVSLSETADDNAGLAALFSRSGHPELLNHSRNHADLRGVQPVPAAIDEIVLDRCLVPRNFHCF